MDGEQIGKVLDLSKNSLKKVPKQDDAQNIRILILDDNDLQKIDNIDSYLRIEKLSLCKNQLLRMYGVCRLHCLKELNLAHNGILSVEGLKELTQLVHLNLEGNNIKTIEHLNTNTKLEYLNLSENSIGNISDISFLKHLKELYLHSNRITHLRQCERNLPISLEILTLTKNGLTDLNEICSLSHLINLQSISIADNPCVQMTGNAVGFDYRPFVLNWCMSAKLIDGFVVNPIESLKAEWLYSQGRGRQFRIGEQLALARYLSQVCPLNGEILENENERKLRLILSKAQHHQRQLQEEISENANTSGGTSPSSARRKSQTSRMQSPRFTRLGRQSSPDSMSSSYHGNTSTSSILSSQTDSVIGNGNNMVHMTTSLISNIQTDNIMVQSLDSTVLVNNNRNNTSSLDLRSVQMNPILNHFNGSPLVTATKMVPVPESLMSPDCPPPSVGQRSSLSISSNLSSTYTPSLKSSKAKDKRISSPKINRNSSTKKIEKSSPVLSNVRKINPNVKSNDGQSKEMVGTVTHIVHKSPVDGSSNDSDDSDHVNVEKLKSIKSKLAQQSTLMESNQSQSAIVNKTTTNSAILIQKMWRGYLTRKQLKDIAVILQKKRTDDYIQKLTQDMETTKVALENERKIQQLQMQAINALWKKVSTMQTTNSTMNTAQTSTISLLNSSETRSGAGTSSISTNDTTSAMVVQDLAKTCTVLTNQVQQLEGSMRDIIKCMSLFLNQSPTFVTNTAENSVVDVRDSCSTQTEIIAVHTPQVDNLPFPFVNKITRPSTLPLESNETSPLPTTAITATNNEEVNINSEINNQQTDGSPLKDNERQCDDEDSVISTPIQDAENAVNLVE